MGKLFGPTATLKHPVTFGQGRDKATLSEGETVYLLGVRRHRFTPYVVWRPDTGAFATGKYSLEIEDK